MWCSTTHPLGIITRKSKLRSNSGWKGTQSLVSVSYTRARELSSCAGAGAEADRFAAAVPDPTIGPKLTDACIVEGEDEAHSTS